MSQLVTRCKLIGRLFDDLENTTTRLEKSYLVDEFRKMYPKLNRDLDFCFEVLAGKHKLGYTAEFYNSDNWNLNGEADLTIRKFYDRLKTDDLSMRAIDKKNGMCSADIAVFIERLVNRTFRLGYSNKKAMTTNLSPMLAKKYFDDRTNQFNHKEQYYYVQEKLDGQRCIAYFLEAGMLGPKGVVPTGGKWYFKARSGLDKDYPFDMSWADTELVYDGEVMQEKKASTRDFSESSGIANSKYGDKSKLHYFIYDILDDELEYKTRHSIVESFAGRTGPNCSILMTIDYLWLDLNPDFHWRLEDHLNRIVSKGGEGLILRDPDAVYKHGEPRTNALLKYKKLQTCDLRIVDWNFGKPHGKYEGAIGSFRCVSDCGTIDVNVAGMPDEMHFGNYDDYHNRIIEVAYFETSKSKKKISESLRFPRFKCFRNDKTQTSLF